jgi:hypothetical protein
MPVGRAHQVALVANVATRAGIMAHGHLLAVGDPEDVAKEAFGALPDAHRYMTSIESDSLRPSDILGADVGRWRGTPGASRIFPFASSRRPLSSPPRPQPRASRALNWGGFEVWGQYLEPRKTHGGGWVRAAEERRCPV